MKIRTCDKCRKEIKSRTPYVKLVKQEWDGKILKQSHCGDLCLGSKEGLV